MNLPEKLELADTYEELISQLYKVFFKDFIESKTFFKAYPVIVSKPRQGEKYPEIFWHVITKEDKKSRRERLVDYKRAKRICWIKPIIQCYNDPDICRWVQKEFDKNSGKEILKYYLWYKRGSFLVILKELRNEKGKKYYLATAFYVNQSNVAYYQDLYDKSDGKDFK